MAEGNSDGDKKHDPTPWRLEEARKKGQVAKSQDLAAAIVLLIAVALLLTIGQRIVADLYEYAYVMLSEPLLLTPDERELGGLRQSTLSLFYETVTRFLDYKKLASLLYFFLLLSLIYR